jgi:hypothetical protein
VTGTVLPSAQVEVVEWTAVAEADKRPAVALREVVPVGLLGLRAVLTKDQRACFFIEQIKARQSERGFPSQPADRRPRTVDDQPVHAPAARKKFLEIRHWPQERHICPMAIPVHLRECVRRADSGEVAVSVHQGTT